MLNWGIIGASGIARVFCNGLQFSKTGRLAAVASRTPGKADTLADLFDCQTRYHTTATKICWRTTLSTWSTFRTSISAMPRR